MPEQPFSGTLKRLLAVYGAEYERAVASALAEAAKEAGLPDGTMPDLERKVFVVPAPPKEAAP